MATIKAKAAQYAANSMESDILGNLPNGTVVLVTRNGHLTRKGATVLNGTLVRNRTLVADATDDYKAITDENGQCVIIGHSEVAIMSPSLSTTRRANGDAARIKELFGASALAEVNDIRGKGYNALRNI